MQRIAFLLETKHDLNVLQCVYNTDNLEISEKEKFSQKCAFRKIELSDAIYVVDIKDILAIRFQKK